jgi:hypothetical protein
MDLCFWLDSWPLFGFLWCSGPAEGENVANCNCPRSSYGVKHTEKCYDETIGKMLGYHVEDEKRIKQLEQMLRNAREKLLLYRKAHSGEYLGGVEFTTLMRSIDAALSDSQSDRGTDGA